MIRFSSLGDIVLNSSILSQLKKSHGEKVKISLLTSSMFAPLYENHPDLHHVYSFSRSSGLKGLGELFRFVANIHQENPIDLFLDLHGTLRSIAIKLRFFSIPHLTVDKRTFERSLLTTFKINILSYQGKAQFKKVQAPHRFGEKLLARTIQDFLGILSLKAIQENDSGRLSSVTQTFHDDPHFKLQDYNLEAKRYICLVPSASFPEKRWPIESFIELVEQLLTSEKFIQYKFVILAGPSDDFCQRFNLFQEKYPNRLVNLQGKTNFVQTTMLTKFAAFCVGNDTGVPHIAESVGTASLFILGPTGEEFGFYPHLKNSEVIMKRLWCRPCTTNGKGNCIRKERYCLTTISASEVFEKMIEMEKRLVK
jgi:ADP-heptose:LPS heptosyltransferase